MKVERKEIFDYLVKLDATEFEALRAISDEFNKSIEDMLCFILDEGIMERFETLE